VSQILSKQDLKQCFSAIDCLIQEWLGGDIPANGHEDYEKWQATVMDRDDIRTLEDARYWIEIYANCDVGDFTAELGL
jgi:hypothetical protein